MTPGADRTAASGSYGRGAFWTSFALVSAATVSVASGIGWLIEQKFVKPPVTRFESSFFEFNLPPGWRCEQQGTEHVCSKGPPPHAAIAILAMKYRGPRDTPGAYLDHLAKVQTGKDKAGEAMVSQVINVGTRRVAGRDWVVGRHYQSEVAGYYTDYYASLTSHVAILVTFSSHHKLVNQTHADIESMMGSLKVYQLEREQPARKMLSKP